MIQDLLYILLLSDTKVNGPKRVLCIPSSPWASYYRRISFLVSVIDAYKSDYLRSRSLRVLLDERPPSIKIDNIASIKARTATLG
jgi:hypothetical protein